MNAVIALEDIHKVYHTGSVDVPAVRGVSTEIKTGEFVAVMGASGSGKSTLMNIIGCLDRADPRALPAGRDRCVTIGSGRVGRHSEPEDRVHLSGLQPAGAHIGRGECRTADAVSARPPAGQRAASSSHAGPRGGGSDGVGRPSSQPAFGRAATTGRHRAGAGQPAGPAAGGRANRQP